MLQTQESLIWVKERKREKTRHHILYLILFQVQNDNSDESLKKQLVFLYTHCLEGRNQHLLRSWCTLNTAGGTLNSPSSVLSLKPHEAMLLFFYKERSQAQRTWVYCPRTVNGEIRIWNLISLTLLTYFYLFLRFWFNRCFFFKAFSDHSD